MTSVLEMASLRDLAPGDHVCWVVDDAESYLDTAAAILRDAATTGEKPVLFGPHGSRPLDELAPFAATAVDPGVAFLDGGVLDPDAMFAMFRRETAIARAHGYRGVRVVADMDWVLPRAPGAEAVIGFEVLLDRRVRELGATVVCAYRPESFGTDAVAGTLSVHPVGAGDHAAPSFRLVAGIGGTWRLSGELDIVDTASFGAAMAAVAREGPCDIDVSALTFIDVPGARSLARAARAAAVPIHLVGARPVLLRLWRLARFAEVAPTVELVA